MIRVISPGPMRENTVRVPLPDAAHDLFASFQGPQQLAVVITEDLGFGDTQAPCGFPGFEFANGRQLRGWTHVMARCAVGHREEFYVVARGGQLGGRAAELDLAIVRVRPDADDPHRTESCRLSWPLSSSQRLPRGLCDVRYSTERFCFQSCWDVLKSDRI